ncbi:Hypothetical predicted protein [Podarcis lilfordi]|uniref:Uncharacterized protein n=1 Tax=Podarcis lilfordi TaxID=74358 RepID=A0AA35LLZ1_9SAUR|nr:Hypothetical predicted protein [Podarcis lilfordi]
MAGKLFPETDIGDSEDVCRRSPLSLETLGGSEDIKESASEGQEPRDKAASKEEEPKEEPGSPLEGEGEGRKETPRPQGTDLLDFRWLQEKEEKGLLQEQLWPPPDNNKEDPLEPRVKEVRLETEGGRTSPQQCPSAGSRPSVKESHHTPSEPRTTPSRLSLQFLVSWVRKIFRKAPSPQPPPQPSTSSGAQVGRPLARRLGRWIAQYRGRIHPRSM